VFLAPPNTNIHNNVTHNVFLTSCWVQDIILVVPVENAKLHFLCPKDALGVGTQLIHTRLSGR
jgi:hypothetical protein